MRSYPLLLVVVAAVPVAADDVFDPKSKLKVEAAGGDGGEGTAWHPQLGGYCSRNNDLNRVAPDGTVSVVRKAAGTNGLLWDARGRLLACEPEQRRVTRTEADGKITVLAERFNGMRFTEPNDLSVDAKGRIYFSD